MVGAQEDGLAPCDRCGDAVPELLLHEWIESRCGLIEYQQLRVGGECCDQGYLLAVSRRVGAAPPVDLELEPLHQLVAVAPIYAGADICQQLQCLSAGQCRPECNIGRHVRQVAMRGSSVARCVPEDPGLARGGPEMAK
ncbi:MAG TPA: hypothetical protein VI094_05460 [Propionibacteriaceae bacterium]